MERMCEAVIDSEKLNDICSKVSEVLKGIRQGRISYDAAAGSPAGVAAQIGQTVDTIGFKAMAGMDVPEEDVQDLTDGLAELAGKFGVEALAPFVEALKAMLG